MGEGQGAKKRKTKENCTEGFHENALTNSLK